MKKGNGFFFLFLVVTLTGFIADAQEKEEFIYHDKIYKPGSNWVTGAAGIGYSEKGMESNMNIAYHLQLKKACINAGYHLSSKEFFLNRSIHKLNDIYAGIGIRRETEKSNCALFGGPSYAFGTKYDYTDTIGRNWYKPFALPGLMISLQYTYKIYYDLGIGLTLYSSLNKAYSVIGLGLHFYFSGAYKGKIK